MKKIGVLVMAVDSEKTWMKKPQSMESGRLCFK